VKDRKTQKLGTKGYNSLVVTRESGRGRRNTWNKGERWVMWKRSDTL